MKIILLISILSFFAGVTGIEHYLFDHEQVHSFYCDMQDNEIPEGCKVEESELFHHDHQSMFTYPFQKLNHIMMPESVKYSSGFVKLVIQPPE